MASKENIKVFLIEKNRINEKDAKKYKEQMNIELRDNKKVKWKIIRNI